MNRKKGVNGTKVFYKKKTNQIQKSEDLLRQTNEPLKRKRFKEDENEEEFSENNYCSLPKLNTPKRIRLKNSPRLDLLNQQSSLRSSTMKRFDKNMKKKVDEDTSGKETDDDACNFHLQILAIILYIFDF